MTDYLAIFRGVISDEPECAESAISAITVDTDPADQDLLQSRIIAAARAEPFDRAAWDALWMEWHALQRDARSPP